jgi:7-carboxy-7-deazaguanine synthase
MPLAPHGIFWTLQGEGALLGTPMVFVRLAGCSVGCVECDTDYRVYRRVTVADIISEVRGVIPATFPWAWIWITGGEPTDHAELPALVVACRAEGWRVALATSGVRPLTPEVMQHVNWISVSPHAREFQARYGHELKIVPGLGQLTWADLPLDVYASNFAHKFVQPLAGSDVQPAIDFVMANPGWRLTPQAHKHWGLP